MSKHQNSQKSFENVQLGLKSSKSLYPGSAWDRTAREAPASPRLPANGVARPVSQTPHIHALQNQPCWRMRFGARLPRGYLQEADTHLKKLPHAKIPPP